MSKFIRLDVKGTFKGTKHRSSFCGMGEENGCWENGISCYELNNIFNAIESLYEYWNEVACCSLDEYKEMQLTVFEGRHNGCFGADGEDLATCIKVVAEVSAYDFMNAIYDAKEALDNYKNDWDEDEDKLNEEEYREIIINLLSEIA